MGTDRQRLTTSHVKVGLPLPGDTFDEDGHLLLSAGFVISSDSQLETLLARGIYVDIATFQAHFSNSGSASPPEARKHDPFLVEESLKKRLNRALRSIGADPGAVLQIKEIAAAIQELTARDPEGAIAGCLLDNDESYSIRHSLFTAILCDLTGTVLGWPAEKRTSAVCAALTMNAAMLDLQNKLVTQTEALNPKQQDVLRGHPEIAADMLREAGVDDPLWLQSVQEHHELFGGTGYPDALKQPGEVGQLVRVADVFGALVSPRGDRKALTPPQALRALLAQEGPRPCATFAGALTKALGVFPPGTFVKLANGEIAVVHRQGAVPNGPFVASLVCSTGNRYMKPVRRDTQRQEFAIAGLVPRGQQATGYDLGVLWVRTL